MKTKTPQLPRPQFKLGQKVVKTTGDYTFMGIITAIFYKQLKGKTELAPDKHSPRYIVENIDGVCHIFSQGQLSLQADLTHALASLSILPAKKSKCEDSKASPKV